MPKTKSMLSIVITLYIYPNTQLYKRIKTELSAFNIRDEIDRASGEHVLNISSSTTKRLDTNEAFEEIKKFIDENLK